MNTAVLSAFVCELEKIAVDMRALSNSVFKARGVTKKLPQQAQSVVNLVTGSPAMTIPTVAQAKTTARFVGPAQTARGEALGRRLEKLTGVSEKALESVLPPGTIYVNPQATAQAFGLPARGTQQRAISGMTGAHELFERGVKPRNVLHPIAYDGHFSPQVLMHEHNMLQRATGPGAHGAVRAMRNARNARGETQGLQDLLHATLGPRSAEFFQGNTKIPKAAKKRVLSMVRENPNLAYRGRSPSQYINEHLDGMEQGIAHMEAAARNSMGTAGSIVKNNPA